MSQRQLGTGAHAKERYEGEGEKKKRLENNYSRSTWQRGYNLQGGQSGKDRSIDGACLEPSHWAC